MFHFQNSVTDWPQAVAMLPAGSLVKAIDRGDILRDVKAINPGIWTALRHYGGPQNIFDGRGYEAYKALARQFFATFIDDTFRAQYAAHTDIVIEWNEYLASSHTGQELQDRIDWARAAAWVWRHEYRAQPEYAHIRLALLSAPVGNDIHHAFAEIALEHDCVLSYHAYDKFVGDHVRDPLSWRYHCGRWNFMEQSWGGLKPDWMFGEAGPYAGVLEGWRHPLVLNGDANAYVEAVATWIRELRDTAAYQDGRVLGFNLFTTGGTSEWQYYETRQPEMDALAAMIRQEWTAAPAPEPTPEPEPEPRRYHRTVHLLPQDARLDELEAVVEAAYPERQTVLFSADDAFCKPPEITGRTVFVWEVERVAGSEAALRDWVATHYAPWPVTSRVRRFAELFVAERWSSPVGNQAQRDGAQLWPEGWIDANPYLNHYDLGYHTGADLNNNSVVFDYDRNMPVYAAASGRVTYAGIPSAAWQRVVVVEHVAPDGSRAYSRYGHLGDIIIAEGQWVRRGQMIGIIGRNMTAAGPGPFHLHFDISPTSALLDRPHDWPGEDRARVVRDYVEPRGWIAARR